MLFTKYITLCLIIVTLFISTLNEGRSEDKKIKRISMAYCKDCVPFQFQNEKGKPSGMIIDLWKLWSKKTKVSIDFYPTTWDETLKQVKEGKRQVHAGLFYNKKRDEYLNYGTKLFKTETHVFLHRNIPPLKNFDELSGYKIGVLKNDYVEDYLKKKLDNESVVSYASYELLFKDLAKGKLKAFAGDTPTGIYLLKKYNLLRFFQINSKQLLYANDWILAVSEKNTHLLAELSRLAMIINWQRPGQIT